MIIQELDNTTYENQSLMSRIPKIRGWQNPKGRKVIKVIQITIINEKSKRMSLVFNFQRFEFLSQLWDYLE